MALFKAGIDFEVVPGLTSAVAGLCYAGIPITHRGVSSGFMVVTAHHKNNQAYEWDYQQFLDDSLTYIFMMGQQKLEQIVTNLLVAGKDKTTPIALISNATRTEQRSIYGTLENIIDKFKDNYLCAPMLIVVGAVVALHHELDFFQRKILLNKKILVACVSDQELPISKYFKEQGAAVKQVQLGKVNYLNSQQKLDLNHKLIVFTSQNGIRGFFNYLKMQRVDHRSLTTVRFACIGEKTANLLQLYGYYSDLISPKANSEDFNNYLKNKRMDSEEMIIVRAKEHSKIKKRAEDHELIVYENKELIIVEEESYHLACFTCASSVERLAKYPSTFKIALSIGPMTTQALKKYYPHVKIIEAKDNSYEGMIAIIKEILMFYRGRRLRNKKVPRNLIKENRLSVEQLISPIFVVAGNNIKKEISSLEGIYHYSIDRLNEIIKELQRAGINACILFGIPEHKDELGTEAYNDDGIIQRAIREIKKIAPEMYVIGDVCMCEYTDHGHCGILDRDGCVINDETLLYLGKIAVSYAKSGVDMVAPSAMMDGEILAIRKALDETGFKDLPIMGYSAKYASSYYGPFRAAANSAPSFGNRSSYQMDIANGNEAMREIQADIDEGADIIMVKPALAFLDVIKEAKLSFNMPICAYNVSGEYAMLKMAVKQGIMKEAVIEESLLAIKRAGADMIITYFALELAQKWQGDHHD